MEVKPKDVNISHDAEEELASHFSEPAYNVKFSDGSETHFNVSDVVALIKAPELNEEKNELETTYHAELISGLSVTLDEPAYDDLKRLKNWTDDKVNGEYNVIE